MKTFSVHFIDAKDGLMNHKLIDAPNIECVCKHMHSLGHEITTIEEKPTMKNQVTLDNDIIDMLKNLVDEIDREEASDECDSDVVVEDLYKVLDIVRSFV